MQGEVGFGEYDRAGHAGWLAGGILKVVKKLADDGEAVPGAGVDTKRRQGRRIKQEARCAAAIVQVSDQVQAVHDSILGRFT